MKYERKEQKQVWNKSPALGDRAAIIYSIKQHYQNCENQSRAGLIGMSLVMTELSPLTYWFQSSGHVYMHTILRDVTLNVLLWMWSLPTFSVVVILVKLADRYLFLLTCFILDYVPNNIYRFIAKCKVSFIGNSAAGKGWSWTFSTWVCIFLSCKSRENKQNRPMFIF